MTAILWLINTVFDLYFYIIIGQVILSWLVAFNMINAYQPFVQSVMSFLHAATEPLLAPIRRVLPAMGGMDLSPLILLLGIRFIQIFINTSLAPVFYG